MKLLDKQIKEMRKIMNRLEELAGIDTPEKVELTAKYDKLLKEISAPIEDEVDDLGLPVENYGLNISDKLSYQITEK